MDCEFEVMFLGEGPTPLVDAFMAAANTRVDIELSLKCETAALAETMADLTALSPNLMSPQVAVQYILSRRRFDELKQRVSIMTPALKAANIIEEQLYTASNHQWRHQFRLN